jgi:hypothetical protein
MKAYVVIDVNHPSGRNIVFNTNSQGTICEAPKLGNSYIEDANVIDLTVSDGVTTASINMAAYTKSLSDKSTAEVDAKWEAMRVERNKRLADTDWAMMSDSPLDAFAKGLYIVYRLDLRNLPDSIVDIDNFNWPEM